MVKTRDIGRGGGRGRVSKFREFSERIRLEAQIQIWKPRIIQITVVDITNSVSKDLSELIYACLYNT